MRKIDQILNIALLFASVFSTAYGMHENYATSSVLSTGKWFRISIIEDGIYRIDYARLKQIGLDNPSNPRIYGNNNGQLSYFNDGSGPDDLKEIPIYTYTGTDGILNEGDFILFYGKGTNRWIYNPSSNDFDFLRHNYSDTAYYFITSGPVQGKKIRNADLPAVQSNFSSSSSDALFIYEKETENLLHSGREWYQPVSYLKASWINPGFTNIIVTEKIKYTIRVLARASVSTVFRFSEGESTLDNITVSGINLASTTGTYAQASEVTGEALPISATPEYELGFTNNGEPSARAWIDYVILHGRRFNTFDGTETQFTDSKSVAPGNITEFAIKSSISDAIIWDITDQSDPELVQYARSGENMIFKMTTDTIRTFIVFSNNKVRTPILIPVTIPNQNIHASGPCDMVIVSHPLFKAYASKLAEIHLKNSGLTSLVVTPGEIYNEFSGGIPDIAAIRNFIRMKYLLQKGTSHPLKYLLLFGDGSFENKTPPPGNTDFIPTYQSKNSNVIISSFASDDFYGLLDDGEGEDAGTEDIGIGRLPVFDTLQAAVIVSKIEKYIDPSNYGDWKNVVCLVADDEDGNTHLTDAEGLASVITENAPWVNVDKIYFDAFKQVTLSTGQFYPDVTKAINDRINTGALIFNYTGHGNESSLAHERVVTSETLNLWKNKSKLPLFITATCEFSRFDDININNITGDMTGRSSTGEKILLDEKGGGIALMSTTRLVYSAPNYALNRNIFAVAFSRDSEGKALCLGDIIRLAKIRSGNNTNKRNFVLLGDPALRLAYPWHGTVVTDSINSMSAGESVDSLKALSVVSITGHIEDLAGNRTNNFNGVVIPLVFGKPSEIQTLANDGGQKMKFSIQNNILFNGLARAENGIFRFTFIVPRDIDYTFGNGKISYYAYDNEIDVNGSYSDIIVGGFSDAGIYDTTGPAISLYINDILFRNGGITDSNPKLFAIIEDKGGINITGSGIGHDLSCWLDNDRTITFILNGFYENDAGSYKKGSVVYGFSGLSPGHHSLTLKAWDNYNNSNEKSINFLVATGEKFILKNLLNFPNPFTDNTKISVEHNRPDGIFNIIVHIFSINGRIIRILKVSVPSSGYQLSPIEWDGNDSNGNRAGRGMYPYRVTITTNEGETASVSGRMIIY